MGIKKKEQVDHYLSCLNTHISNKASDATDNCNDSYAGMASWGSGVELEKALYDLFDIPYEKGEYGDEEEDEEDITKKWDREDGDSAYPLPLDLGDK